ncbi:acyltransferase [Streptomyces sp. NPDC049555]|uniref:acyltransferase family protein n=1 Tax=Streptomyces sp. NPDC049555 TaxID=3154930 RepID=UPI003433B851
MQSSVTVQQRQQEQRPVPAPARPAAAKERLAALDGLRLLAALMVVLYHYMAFNAGAWSKPVAQIFTIGSWPASYGWAGVELFFLISGFVICMSAWGRTVGEFASSRVTRLYPAYWFAVIATALVSVIWPGINNVPKLGDITVNLTMLHEPLKVTPVDGVYWTLWVELKFYLLFALVVWKGLTYRRALGFCVVWGLAAAFATTVNVPVLDALLLPDDCWYFIAGIAFYLMYRYGPNLVLWLIVASCYLISQHFLMQAQTHAEKYIGRNVPEWPTTMLLTLFFLAMAAVALGWTRRIRWGWLSTAGVLTYPLYLLHERIGWVVIQHTEPYLSQYVLVPALIAAMLGAAWLLHRFWERPLARLVKRGMNRALADMRTARERI